MYKIKKIIFFSLIFIFKLNASDELDGFEKIEWEYLISQYYLFTEKYSNSNDIEIQKKFLIIIDGIKKKLFDDPKKKVYRKLINDNDKILINVKNVNKELRSKIIKYYGYKVGDLALIGAGCFYLYKKLFGVNSIFNSDFAIPLILMGWYFFRSDKVKNISLFDLRLPNQQNNNTNPNQPSGESYLIKVKETFDSVAGADEAKEDLKEIVDFLRNPMKFSELGAKIPKGILLMGEPGNGKTLLAKAVAGEVKCPFLTVCGSEFIDKYVGVGASRVRELFAYARKIAPCIIFIDEIDAIGHKRGVDYESGGISEHAQTLNQLLNEMDGFEKPEKPIVIIGATNNANVLDPALLRPGRFDRRIEVSYPDLISREQILRIHVENIKINDEDIDLKKIALKTIGFSGADLANLVNEAALNATKENKKFVDTSDFSAAYDKITLGRISKTKVYTKEVKEITAYHEAGHALMQLLLPNSLTKLEKVTILPRGKTGGVTHFIPTQELTLITTKEQILMHIKIGLAGRAAEQVQFNTFTQGACSDLEDVTARIRSYICDYGMSDKLGPMLYKVGKYGFKHFSDLTNKEIDNEIKNIIDACYNDVINLLKQNKDKLDKLAQALIEKEILHADEVYKLLDIKPRD